MFTSHLSEISITRNEPNQDFDAEEASRKVGRRFARLAEKIILNSWIKEPKPEKRAQAHARIRQLIEFDERMRSVKGFLAEWNRWRKLYFDLPAQEPKTKGQLTVIEDAVAFANEKELKLPILLGAVHKAFQKRKYRPNYHEVMLHGLEYYARYYDDVIADLDRMEYEEISSERV